MRARVRRKRSGGGRIVRVGSRVEELQDVRPAFAEDAPMTTLLVDRLHAPEALERRTREIGRALFDRIGRGPSPWERGWWDDRLMNLTLDDPEVKVQLFRFIDAMPVLTTTELVRRHLAEYLGEAGDRVPWFLRLALALAPSRSPGAEVLARLARQSAAHMAHRFIAGETPAQA